MSDNDSNTTYCSDVDKKLNKSKIIFKKHIVLPSTRQSESYRAHIKRKCTIRKMHDSSVDKLLKNNSKTMKKVGKYLPKVNNIRSKLMNWYDIIYKHISGKKKVDCKSVKNYIIKLKGIHPECDMHIELKQVWEKLMRQFNSILSEYKSNSCVDIHSNKLHEIDESISEEYSSQRGNSAHKIKTSDNVSGDGIETLLSDPSMAIMPDSYGKYDTIKASYKLSNDYDCYSKIRTVDKIGSINDNESGNKLIQGSQFDLTSATVTFQQSTAIEEVKDNCKIDSIKNATKICEVISQSILPQHTILNNNREISGKSDNLDNMKNLTRTIDIQSNRKDEISQDIIPCSQNITYQCKLIKKSENTENGNNVRTDSHASKNHITSATTAFPRDAKYIWLNKINYMRTPHDNEFYSEDFTDNLRKKSYFNLILNDFNKW